MSTFKNRLLLSYIAYGVALALVAVFTINILYESNIEQQQRTDTVEKFVEQKNSFNEYTKNIEKKLFTIRDSKIFKQYLNDGSDSNIAELFSYIANTSEDIMQLRYINNHGFEKIRMDRREIDTVPILVSNDNLQNKAHRYYFKKIIELNNEEEVWYSNIDLNIEHSQIEKPVKPVLRVGIPIFVKNKKVGILIVNIYMKYFLNQTSSLALYNIY
ncbi:MAG: histidine kinase, partial [Sulfurimonas sp.]